MSKYIKVFSILLFLFLLIGCNLSKTTTSRITSSSGSSAIPSTDANTSMLTTITTDTTTTQTTKMITTTQTTETTTVPTTTKVEQNQPFQPEGYSLLHDELDSVGIPSSGNVKVLVFAVDFSDYTALSSGVTISDINNAFNGTSQSTQYESLNSYYKKSSYNQLNLSADIFGFYRASKPSTYYEDEYEKAYAWDEVNNDYLYGEDEITYPDSDIIYELLTYYNNQINYQDYDANNDGKIDGIYIIYTAPVSYEYGSDFWWAYQDYYAYYDDKFDLVEPNYFCWSGTDFLLEGDGGINAKTLIHETGHMLGLEDYYDYATEDSYNSGGLGGADMMDNTVGDHNPFSKLLLGWIRPFVVTENMEVSLTPFINSGDTLLIINRWNDTIFDEYLLITFYTPTDLNYLDRDEIFSISGILIYHIDAKKGNSNPDSNYPSTIFTYNNTDSSHKLISIIEADQDNDIIKKSDAENSDLFQPGSVFKENIYPNYEWYNNSIEMNFTIQIVSISSDLSTIKIDFDNK